jgi:excinuclease UvrABC helicase subunit UvrB
MFKLVSKYKPSAAQPQAIEQLVNGINNEKIKLILLYLNLYLNYS